jgi:hypothetical protein
VTSRKQNVVRILIEVVICILHVPCEGFVRSRVDPVPNSLIP